MQQFDAFLPSPQIACMRHFQTRPLSVLAGAAAAGGGKALEKAAAAASMQAVRDLCRRKLSAFLSVEGCAD